MSMLPARDLAAMRREMQRMLPDTATIQRRTIASDGGGGQTETRATLAASVPCRIAPTGGGESGSAMSDDGDRVRDESTHVVTFANGQDITETDRILIDGSTYEVLLVRQRGTWELTRRCEVVEAS